MGLQFESKNLENQKNLKYLFASINDAWMITILVRQWCFSEYSVCTCDHLLSIISEIFFSVLFWADIVTVGQILRASNAH